MSVDSDDGRMHLLFRMSCFFSPDKSRVVSRVVHPTFCDFVSVARVCRVARACFYHLQCCACFTCGARRLCVIPMLRVFHVWRAPAFVSFQYHGFHVWRAPAFVSFPISRVSRVARACFYHFQCCARLSCGRAPALCHSNVACVCRVARVCFCVVVSLPGLQEDSCLFSLTFRRVLHVFTYFIGSSTLTRFYKRLFVKRNSRS